MLAVNPELFAAYLFATVVLILMPGPIVTLVIANSLAYGQRAGLATVALFVPPVVGISGWNIAWLIAAQAVLYVALTAYVTPAFSLVADLGYTPEERLDLATWTSVAWAAGIVVAATTPFLAGILDDTGLSTLRSWQVAAAMVAAVGVAAMYVPRSFAVAEPAEVLTLVRHASFGHLVSADDDATLTSTALPFVVDDDLTEVRAHVARANPHWRSLDGRRSLLIVPVADTYISPRNNLFDLAA